MTAFRRLSLIAKPYRRNLVIGLMMAVISTFIETVVVTGLISGMLTLIVPDKNAIKPAAAVGASKISDLLPMIKAAAAHLLAQIMPQGLGVGQLLIVLAVLAAVSVFFKCLCHGRAAYLIFRFANLLSQDLRLKLFRALVKQPPAFFEKERTGVQLTRITGDVATLQQCLGPDLLHIVQSPLTVIFALLAMTIINWRLTLIVLCLAPLIALAMAIAGRKIRKLVVTIQERSAELNAGLIERLANIRIIQSFVREKFETQHITEYNRNYYKETMRAVLLTETLSPLVEFIAWAGMILGVILGGYEVFSGRMLGGDFLFFMFLAQRAGSQFKYLSRVNQLRQQIEGTGSRIFSTLDVVPEIQDLPEAKPLPHIQGKIEFRKMSFHYKTGGDVLKEIDFTVSPGEVIALVGPSGSGKSTLVNMLPRFYDPTAGSILIDGMDLRHVTLDSLREQIGIVPQETALFSGTIYENILYGKLEATEVEVIEATRDANALEFIERLQDGFNTIVGERGTRLSGGQRQRVAIARALLKNPRVLILDEATSALDTESENLVQQALERLMQNRTTFVIAHRLSTVQGATRILVLDHGRIVEAGNHEELLRHGGLYARLYEMQFRTGNVGEEAGLINID